MSTWTLTCSLSWQACQDRLTHMMTHLVLMLCVLKIKINYKNIQKSTHSYSHSFFTFAQFERHNQICRSGSNALGKSQWHWISISFIQTTKGIELIVFFSQINFSMPYLCSLISLILVYRHMVYVITNLLTLLCIRFWTILVGRIILYLLL